MSFALSDEQEELRRSLRRFLEEKSPLSDVRRLMESANGYDPAVWSQMADQLGLQGLIVPEVYGGSGFSYIELAIVLEEMGGALLCAPFFSTVALATNALMCSGDEEAKRAYLPRLAAGETLGTLALVDDDGRWDLAEAGVRAREKGAGWILDGHKSFVIDGHTAGLILVAADAPQGLTLFAVASDAPGLVRTPLPTMDQTRKLARLEFSETLAQLVGEPGNARVGLDKTLDLAAIALAAEQTGGAQRCLDMSTGYARTRIQFGRPIGSFQAIKHKCADILAEVESARSAFYYAAAAVAEDSDEVPVVASLAKSYCSEAYFHAAAENIQIHGGIGFTWEHDAHLYFKRAKSSELLFGDPSYHREILAQRIGI